MKRLLVALAILLAPSIARADLYTYNFIGHVGQIGYQGNDFGTGVQAGDAFSGFFTYDPATGAAVSFQMTFPSGTIVGANVSISLFSDFYIDIINVQAMIPGGFYMDVGLANPGTSTVNPTLPLILDCADWLQCGFQIKASSFPAVEQGWLDSDSIGSLNNFYNSNPDAFSFVPEPPAWLLAGLGLVIFVASARRLSMR